MSMFVQCRGSWSRTTMVQHARLAPTLHSIAKDFANGFQTTKWKSVIALLPWDTNQTRISSSPVEGMA
eukprot:scaffold967_cov321-Pavlova_lutheri.AAC.34